MSSDQPGTSTTTPGEKRDWTRFARFFVFLLGSLVLFVGGGSALLYLVFSEYSGARNIWLLVCGAPILLIVIILISVAALYTRYGRPVEQIVNAIDSISEGNLTVRVPEDNSPQFQRIIQRFNKMVAELERAEQQRRNLTADIAHELRTPLHIIQGNLEGILDGVYEPTSEHIQDTLDETRLLSRLVNDLQTLSLAETGQLPLHPTRFRVADLMADLTSSFSSQATSQGIHLQTRLSNPDHEFTADYDRLNQVLTNLLTNALRHTPSGGTISIRTKAVAGNPNHPLQIVIQDTGSGIPAEDLPFIFDRFWRGERSRTERAHSGLGLAIAKQLILAHGGRIEVESEPGRGTTFTIELPDHPQDNVEQQPQ